MWFMINQYAAAAFRPGAARETKQKTGIENELDERRDLRCELGVDRLDQHTFNDLRNYPNGYR
jgi:hypothetical protein